MFLRSFLQGCIYGLHDKFCAEKEDLKSECDITALAISMKAEIDEFLKDEKIGNAKLGKINIDSLCANRGYKVGKNIQINKGVYAGVVNKDKRLMQ